jgi:hypothetical protein
MRMETDPVSPQGKGETDPVSETSYFLVFRIPEKGQSSEIQ